MEPITIESPESKSADVVAENVERLRELFPSAFADGEIDFDALRQLLGDHLSDPTERFGLNWHGKSKARAMALVPSTATLRPSSHSTGSQNVLIEGDNLETLKALRKAYAGRAKLIFVDPPYNTGKDFVYPDSYHDPIDNYLRLTGARSDGQAISSNREASGRFHTQWLNTMLPRFMLAHSLLREDGALFVTIDDNESGNLRLLLDEVFGPENFVTSISWFRKASPSNDATWFSSDHDTILVYAKAKEIWRPRRLRMNERQLANYKNPDGDPRGPWNSATYTCNRSAEERPNLYYPIRQPKTGEEIYPDRAAVWAYSRDAHAEHVANDMLYWGKDGKSSKPRLKIHLSNAKDVVPRTVWLHDEVGHTQEATRDLMSVLPGAKFETPKPVRLLQRILQIGTQPNGGDLVIDFFAGSGTTGEAVMRQNSEDGGDRRFLLVQLPEPVDSSTPQGRDLSRFLSENGLEQTLSALTQERLKRASAIAGGGTANSFDVFRLDESCINTWCADKDDLEDTLLSSVEHIKPDRTDEDVLFEIILKLGIELTTPLGSREVGGKTAYSAGAGSLIVCIPERITRDEVEEVAQGITAWVRDDDPAGDTRIVFRDSAFEDDVAKSNMTAILEQNGFDRANIRSI